MGIDIELLIEPKTGSVNEDILDLLNDLIQSDGYDKFLRREDGCIYWETIRRFYCPYYPRGDFGFVYTILQSIWELLPDCKIYYDGDSESSGKYDTRNEPDGLSIFRSEITREKATKLYEFYKKWGRSGYDDRSIRHLEEYKADTKAIEACEDK